MKKIRENKVGCLVVSCHEQDKSKVQYSIALLFSSMNFWSLDKKKGQMGNYTYTYNKPVTTSATYVKYG